MFLASTRPNDIEVLIDNMKVASALKVAIVHTPLLSTGGLTGPNFQKEGAWQDLNFYSGIAGKEGVAFFRREVSIFTQNIKIWNV